MARYYVITWIETPGNPDMPPYRRGPLIVQRRGNNLVWMNGGHCNWPENAEILKTYEKKNTDAALMTFYADYPREPEPARYSAGWIAPDGKFYPCRSWAHDGVAVALTARYYKSLEGTRALEERGWLRLYEDGLVGNMGRHEIELTQAQRDLIFDLLQLPDTSDDWQWNHKTTLELY